MKIFNNLMKTVFLSLTAVFFYLECLSQNDFSIVDFFNKTTLYLEAHTQENKVYKGSGFIVLKDSKRYLITNFHILQDTDYYSGIEHLPKGPYNNLRVWNLYKDSIKSYFDIPLELNGSPNYYRNSYLDQLTDLAAFEIPDSINLNAILIDFKEYNKYKSSILNLNTEIYVSGFPGFADERVANIVLMAEIISPPNLDIITKTKKRVPIIYINQSGIGGLSGSPVFTFRDKNKPPIFIGVFSGTGLNNQGFFWRPDIVEDLVNNIKPIK